MGTTERLRKIYNNPKDPGSFGGEARLWMSARRQIPNLTRKRVGDFLKGEDSYTLHRQYRRRYPRNRVFVSRIDQQWEADLVEMREFSKENKGYNYLLTVVDVLSKYAWAIPVKKKDSVSMVQAFNELFKMANPRIPEKLHTDKGREFFNAGLAGLLKQRGIIHFATHGDTKAAIAERFNRTLKARMWRYFTSANTHKWFDVIDGLLDGYNRSTHRSIAMAPASVKKSDEERVWRKLYGRGQVPKTGEYVRISKQRRVFDKGYLPGWTQEVFRIEKRLPWQRPLYKLSDLMGEDIKGSFYREEIQPVKYDPDTDEYRVERIIKTRIDKNTRKKSHLVKWLGWPDKFNSWVNDGDLRGIAP